MLAYSALFVLRSCASTAPHPSPVGQWTAEGTTGARLALLEGGRLGPSAIPAAACRESEQSPATDDLWEVRDGTWEAGYETDAGHQVWISFAQPKTCHLALSSHATGGKHTLWLGEYGNSWTFDRP